VLVDRKLTSFIADAVIINNFFAGKTAAEYLLSKGHLNTAIISGPLGIYTMSERFKGFESVFTERKNKSNLISIETEFSIKGGYNAALAFLKERKDTTAVFCSNYELTLGTVMAVNELGIKFPEDISIIGFDNMELSKIIKPSLTIIEQPMEQIARTAAELLLKRLDNGNKVEFETIVLGTELVEGGSTAKIN
jgi:LacI family transcriptional regulator